MNEVEKHYGQEPERTGASASGSGAVGTAKRAVETARETLEDAYEGATSWATSRYESASRYGRRSVAGVGRHRRTVETFVDENPIMVGVAGLAVGLLVGSLLPITRRENQYLGRYADEVKEQGIRYAQQLAEQGRQVVEENVRSLAQAGGRDHGDETSAVR